MKKIKRSFSFFFYILFLFDCIKFVFADLPIHALIRDIKGDWRFYLTQSFDGIATCGSDSKNSNTRNLRDEIKNYKEFLKKNYGAFSRTFDLRLSTKSFSLKNFMQEPSKTSQDELHRTKWNPPAVFQIHQNEQVDEQKPVGMWTAIYDEGFEIVIGSLRLTAILNYMPLTNEKDLTDVSSSLLSSCKIINKNKFNDEDYHCYFTNPSKIHIGWYTEEKKDSLNGIVSGCFYAEKINNKSKNIITNSNSLHKNFITPSKTHHFSPALAAFSSFVVLNNVSKNTNTNNNKLNYNLSKDFVNNHNSIQNVLWKAKVNNFLFDEKQKMNLNKIFNERENDKETQQSLMFLQHVGIKKIHLNDERYEVAASFVEQKEISNHNLFHSNKIQLYACPCKNNEKILDTSNSVENRNKVKAIAPTVEPSFISIASYIREKNRVVADNVNLDLPENFSWGDPFNDNDFVYEKQSQASCGSCYVMATEFVLRKRFEIQVQKITGKKLDLFKGSSLSSQFILICSMQNQGCNGGYPYLVAKFFKEIGAPLSSCLPYKADDVIKCPINYLSNNLQVKNNNPVSTSDTCTASDQRWYAKSYGYVGGCYQCNNCDGEKNMQQEIFAKGPIMAAFDMPKSFFFYSDGIFDVGNNSHERTCDDHQSNKNLSGWEFTNHAVVLVGWGEDVINNEVVKYWIGRNSWGPNWGKKGYFKIIRGKNSGGVENQSSWIDPDFSRGAGKLLHEHLLKKPDAVLQNSSQIQLQQLKAMKPH